MENRDLVLNKVCGISLDELILPAIGELKYIWRTENNFERYEDQLSQIGPDGKSFFAHASEKCFNRFAISLGISCLETGLITYLLCM